MSENKIEVKLTEKSEQVEKVIYNPVQVNISENAPEFIKINNPGPESIHYILPEAKLDDNLDNGTNPGGIGLGEVDVDIKIKSSDSKLSDQEKPKNPVDQLNDDFKDFLKVFIKENLTKLTNCINMSNLILFDEPETLEENEDIILLWIAKNIRHKSLDKPYLKYLITELVFLLFPCDRMFMEYRGDYSELKNYPEEVAKVLNIQIRLDNLCAIDYTSGYYYGKNTNGEKSYIYDMLSSLENIELTLKFLSDPPNTIKLAKYNPDYIKKELMSIAQDTGFRSKELKKYHL